MVKHGFSQEEVDIKELTIELKRVVDLLEKHISDCEEQHESYNTGLEKLEKSYVYFNIWDKLKTIGLITASAIIGYLFKTAFGGA